jgi:hypothetical protein
VSRTHFYLREAHRIYILAASCTLTLTHIPLHQPRLAVISGKSTVKVPVTLIGQHAPIKVRLTEKMAGDGDLLTFREFIDVCLPARISRKMREIHNPFVEILSVNDFVDRIPFIEERCYEFARKNLVR